MGLLLASVHHPFTKYFPSGGGAFQRQSSRGDQSLPENP